MTFAIAAAIAATVIAAFSAIHKVYNAFNKPSFEAFECDDPIVIDWNGKV